MSDFKWVDHIDNKNYAAFRVGDSYGVIPRSMLKHTTPEQKEEFYGMQEEVKEYKVGDEVLVQMWIDAFPKGLEVELSEIIGFLKGLKHRKKSIPPYYIHALEQAKSGIEKYRRDTQKLMGAE